MAGGADIWEKSDQFHFVYKQVHGDFDIAVRVESVLGLKFVDSGVQKCTVWKIKHWFHGFLTIDGQGWGFYPVDNEVWGPGKIVPDDPRSASCRKIHVDDCRVDLNKLRTCIRNKIASDRAKPPPYSAVLNNCWDWRDGVWDYCLNQAQDLADVLRSVFGTENSALAAIDYRLNKRDGG